MQSFPFLELVFFLVIFLLFFRGLLKGTLRELFSLGIILFSFYIVNSWSSYFIFLKSFFIRNGFSPILFKYSLFLFIWFAGVIILFVVFKFINLKAKGCFSRFLGGIICLLKGYILIFVVFPSLSNYSLFQIKFIKNSDSFIMPFLKNLNRQVFELFLRSDFF